jgi:hypothetical protein
MVRRSESRTSDLCRAKSLLMRGAARKRWIAAHRNGGFTPQQPHFRAALI